MGARLLFIVTGLAFAGCRTVDGPEVVASTYARALREGRLESAYALTSADYRARVPFEAFKAQYRDEQPRRERADALLEGLPKMSARSAGLEAVCESGGWKVAEEAPGEGPKAALARFLDAADAGDFTAAYGMLSEAWRARYTPALFARDFAAEPLAKERLSRAREALAAALVWGKDEVQLPLGGGKAVRLSREGGSYKVAALE